jgi:hypothetical protein
MAWCTAGRRPAEGQAFEEPAFLEELAASRPVACCTTECLASVVLSTVGGPPTEGEPLEEPAFFGGVGSQQASGLLYNGKRFEARPRSPLRNLAPINGRSP